MHAGGDPAPDGDGIAMPRLALPVAAITMPAVFTVLDGAMLTIALPAIAAELAVSAQAAIWVIIAYQLATVVCLLPLSVVADRIGYGRLFAGGVVLYTLASLGAAYCTGFPALILARIVQGIGSAGVMSCASALLRASYPARLFATGIALNTFAVTLAAAAGPSVGAAMLVVSDDWQSLFLIAIPFNLVAWCCTHTLPATRGQPRRFDIGVVLLNAMALGFGLVGLSLLATTPLWALALLMLTAMAWALWLRVERKRDRPLLPLDLFRLPAFSFSIAASSSMFAAQSCALTALPFYLLTSRGMAVLEAGTLLTAWPVLASATSLVTPRLRRYLRVARLCQLGAVMLILALGCIVWLSEAAPPGWQVLGFMLGGLSIGLFQAPNMHAMLSATPRSRAGATGSVQAIARVGGAAFGAAVAGLCFAFFGGEGPVAGLAGAALLALLALLVNTWRARVLQ